MQRKAEAVGTKRGIPSAESQWNSRKTPNCVVNCCKTWKENLIHLNGGWKFRDLRLCSCKAIRGIPEQKIRLMSHFGDRGICYALYALNRYSSRRMSPRKREIWPVICAAGCRYRKIPPVYLTNADPRVFAETRPYGWWVNFCLCVGNNIGKNYWGPITTNWKKPIAPPAARFSTHDCCVFIGENAGRSGTGDFQVFLKCEIRSFPPLFPDVCLLFPHPQYSHAEIPTHFYNFFRSDVEVKIHWARIGSKWDLRTALKSL